MTIDPGKRAPEHTHTHTYESPFLLRGILAFSLQTCLHRNAASANLKRESTEARTLVTMHVYL